MSDAAWGLVCLCVRTSFRSLQTMRTEAVEIDDLGEDASKGKVLWAVLQSHELIDDRIEKEFRSHTVLVHRITLFMLQNRVDQANVAALDMTLDELRGQVGALEIF